MGEVPNTFRLSFSFSSNGEWFSIFVSEFSYVFSIKLRSRLLIMFLWRGVLCLNFVFENDRRDPSWGVNIWRYGYLLGCSLLKFGVPGGKQPVKKWEGSFYGVLHTRDAPPLGVFICLGISTLEIFSSWEVLHV